MKTILLHIDGDTCMDARLEVAMDIARRCDGHITCLQAVSYEVFAPGDFYGSAMAAAMPRIKEAAEELRRTIETDLSNEGVSWEWRFLYGMAESRLLEQSALHDIVVVGPHDVGEEGSRGPSALAGALALKAPVPVLVVPGDSKGFDLDKPVLVAWNGSSESAVALRRAVPLLERTGTVYIASVVEDDGRERLDFPASEAAKYCDRHGLRAEIVEIPRGEAKISDTIFSAATARDCSMVVMGGYGHSRLAEMLLGGVTRRALTDPQMPIFLAH
ncbi:MAG: universal stress protein [Erythrobacter sp.]|uniref:universal stress protein n=1 Tax=Erythrobacter sp. TaxID=1042 RepID=UPI003C73200E